MPNLPLPNRLAAYGTAAIALLAGLAPLVGNLDWESTAGIIAGLGAILTVAVKWLTGWQEYAKRELYDRGEDTALELDVDEEPPIDGFDENEAEPVPEQVFHEPAESLPDKRPPDPPQGTTLHKT